MRQPQAVRSPAVRRGEREPCGRGSRRAGQRRGAWRCCGAVRPPSWWCTDKVRLMVGEQYCQDLVIGTCSSSCSSGSGSVGESSCAAPLYEPLALRGSSAGCSGSQRPVSNVVAVIWKSRLVRGALVATQFCSLNASILMPSCNYTLDSNAFTNQSAMSAMAAACSQIIVLNCGSCTARCRAPVGMREAFQVILRLRQEAFASGTPDTRKQQRSA